MVAQPTISPSKKLWQLNQQYISSQKFLAAQPTLSPAKKFWQFNQQYLQTKSSGSSTNIISSQKFWQLNQQYISSQKVLAVQPTISLAQKVLAAKPTISPAKKIWQLQPTIYSSKSYGSSINQQFLQPKNCVCNLFFMVHTVWNCSRIITVCPYFTGHSMKVKFVLYHLSKY